MKLKDLLNEKRKITGIKRPLKKVDVHNLERALDYQFKSLGFDVDLKSDHFIERVIERTSGSQISFNDLKNVFLGLKDKHGKTLKNHGYDDPKFQAMVRDLAKFINIPIVVGPDDTPNDDTPYELRAKTITIDKMVSKRSHEPMLNVNKDKSYLRKKRNKTTE